MGYPNVLNYTNTNKVTIQTVKEMCQEENNLLQQDIIDAVTEVGDSIGQTQVVNPLTQNITRAMGDFWFSVDGTIPPGGLPHLGHLVSREAYGDFYLWLESTKIILTDEEWLAYAESHGGCCPHYSSGDGSTTFRTPKYDNAFLKTISSINGAGVYEEEGLPDHKHIQGGVVASTASYGRYGKIDTGLSGGVYDTGSANTGTYGMYVSNASLDNPIYGNSEHVTPKNIGMMIGVYAVGAVATVGTTDAEKIMSGITTIEGILDNKVDKSCPYVIETWNSESSGYRIYSDGFIEQWGKYTSTSSVKYTAVITLYKEYKDSNYNISISSTGLAGDKWGEHGTNIENVTSTSFEYWFYTASSADGTTGFYWYACGY